MIKCDKQWQTAINCGQFRRHLTWSNILIQFNEFNTYWCLVAFSQNRILYEQLSSVDSGCGDIATTLPLPKFCITSAQGLHVVELTGELDWNMLNILSLLDGLPRMIWDWSYARRSFPELSGRHNLQSRLMQYPDQSVYSTYNISKLIHIYIYINIYIYIIIYIYKHIYIYIQSLCIHIHPKNVNSTCDKALQLLAAHAAVCWELCPAPPLWPTFGSSKWQKKPVPLKGPNAEGDMVVSNPWGYPQIIHPSKKKTYNHL